MNIICMANEKGGTGKSTVAINIGLMAVKEGKRVLFIDADPQASGFAFYERRQENENLKSFQMVMKPSKSLHRDIDELSRGFDLVIIDIGGRDSKIFRSAILASTHVIIPTQPSQFDLWSLSNTLDIIEEARVFKPIEAKVLLNMVPARAKLTEDTLSTIKEEEIPCFKTTLGFRVAFREAITQGLSVMEYEPKGKAAFEIKKLWEEIKTWLDIK
ncbi:MAG: ParA family partition ATPase [Desulfonauticus sp.]|nr:ParA family partition ATPase [Desulfonauticus sp.]